MHQCVRARGRARAVGATRMASRVARRRDALAVGIRAWTTRAVERARCASGTADGTNRTRFSAKRVVRGVSRDALFAVVRDVNEYAKFVPFCAGARVTERETWGEERARAAAEGGEEYFEAELEIGFRAFSERYTSAVTCAAPERVTARCVSSGLFRSMTTRWSFSPLDEADEGGDDGSGLPRSEGVVVDFEIDFEVRDPLHAAAVSVVFDDVARSQIQAFEKRCRQLALQKSYPAAKGAKE